MLTAAGTPDPTGRLPWPERDLALAAVLVGTGVRAGELCGMRVRDLVLDAEDPYVRVTGKGNAVRDCPLPREPVDAIAGYLDSRHVRTRKRPRRDDPVWFNNHGDPLTPATLDHYVRRWFARAGVPLPHGAQAHAFRHTVAMQLVGRCEALNVVQAILGHALRSTEIYIRAAGHHVRGEVGPGRPAGVSTGGFPRAASRTRRARFRATGAPQAPFSAGVVLILGSATQPGWLRPGIGSAWWAPSPG